MKSTGTRDIRQARLFRDAIALEWTRLRNLLKPQGGSSVDQIIDELRRVSVRQGSPRIIWCIGSGLPFPT
jgi:hypothetical protein